MATKKSAGKSAGGGGNGYTGKSGGGGGDGDSAQRQLTFAEFKSGLVEVEEATRGYFIDTKLLKQDALENLNAFLENNIRDYIATAGVHKKRRRPSKKTPSKKKK
jgi:hypothetical protein